MLPYKALRGGYSVEGHKIECQVLLNVKILQGIEIIIHICTFILKCVKTKLILILFFSCCTMFNPKRELYQ